MRAVFTYYTHNEKKINQNWLNFESFAKYFYLSVVAAARFFSEVIIYTDSPKIVKSIFKDNEQIQIITIDFNEKIKFPPSLWNIPKLISYNIEAQAGNKFIHIDNDLILHEKPKNLDKAVFCEMKRHSTVRASHFNEIGISNLVNSQEIICSGILGGNDTAAFIELYNRAEKTLQYINSNPTGLIRFVHLFIIEEFQLTDIVGIENAHTVNCDFTHYQGIKRKEVLSASA